MHAEHRWMNKIDLQPTHLKYGYTVCQLQNGLDSDVEIIHD